MTASAAAAGGARPALAPTPLEIALGGAFGALDDPARPPLAASDDGLTPRAALERSVLAALERPPCAVAFSGGRDSSAVLALAVAVARREGLPPPVPVFVRFREAPGTGEAEWQELVLRSLGVEGERIDVADELDLVGPAAAGVLARHGVVHPPHAHLFAHVLERSRARSLVTGFGGDQVLGGWIRTRLAGRAGVAAHAVWALSPRPVRRAALRPRALARPWLTEAASAEARRRWLADAATEPASWSSYLEWIDRRRGLAALRWALARLGQDAGASVFHPFLDRPVLAALARAGGRRGLGDRTALMRLLVGDLLPDELVARPTKARYFYAYFRDPSRAFAKRWDGRGLDEAIVDPERVRSAWLARLPPGGSALALQAAWLASGGQVGDAQRGLPERPPVGRPA